MDRRQTRHLSPYPQTLRPYQHQSERVVRTQQVTARHPAHRHRPPHRTMTTRFNRKNK